MVTSLETRLRAGTPLTLGELTISVAGDVAEIRGPESGREPVTVAGGTESLRDWVRADGSGGYRPLSGARTMRPDWVFRCERDLLRAAIDTIYPLALVHREMASAGTLRIVGLEEVLARQTKGARRSVPEAVETALERVVCGACVRSPVWRSAAAGDVLTGEIPCPEPCSVVVALCRRALEWETQFPRLPRPDAPDPSVPYAQFENPKNALRVAYLKAREAGVGLTSPGKQEQIEPGVD